MSALGGSGEARHSGWEIPTEAVALARAASRPCQNKKECAKMGQVWRSIVERNGRRRTILFSHLSRRSGLRPERSVEGSASSVAIGRPLRRLVLALGAALCWTTPQAYADEAGYETANKLVSNVVGIRANWGGKSQSGFGIIVGERDRLLYIATVNHVVRGAGPNDIERAPTLLFSHRQATATQGKLLDTFSRSADLAVVTVETSQVPGLNWARDALSAGAVESGLEVRFIGHEQKWIVPFRPGRVASVADVPRDEFSVLVATVERLNVTPGTLGAPLVSDDGIVGMIVSVSDNQQVEAVAIERIEALIKQWGHPWQLSVNPPRQDCDRLAASPYDLNRPRDVPGVELDKIDESNAFMACYMLVFKYQDKVPRFAYQMGRVAESGKRLPGAESMYGLAAKAGHAAAQSSLGMLYERQNKTSEAAALYRQAAEQGDPVGQVGLATMLRDGYGGLGKNNVEAVRLYRVAAEQGYPAALAGLAWMYENGRGGLPPNEAEARKLYMQAAAKGDAYAHRALRRLGP